MLDAKSEAQSAKRSGRNGVGHFAPGALRFAPFAWLVLVVFALLMGGVVLFQQQSQRGTAEPEYSTYRTDPLGCKALFLTLENMGYRPVRWHQDFTNLPSPGLLFLIAPPASGRLLQ